MDLKPYIYNNGFRKRYHICSQCGSKAMRMDPVGGFQAPDYLCMECGSVERSPDWELIIGHEEEDEATEAWISGEDYVALLRLPLAKLN